MIFIISLAVLATGSCALAECPAGSFQVAGEDGCFRLSPRVPQSEIFSVCNSGETLVGNNDHVFEELLTTHAGDHDEKELWTDCAVCNAGSSDYDSSFDRFCQDSGNGGWCLRNPDSTKAENLIGIDYTASKSVGVKIKKGKSFYVPRLSSRNCAAVCRSEESEDLLFCPEPFQEGYDCGCYVKSEKVLQPDAESACDALGAEWVTGEDHDYISKALSSIGFGTVWTNASVVNKAYVFHDGTPVENDGVPLDFQKGRPYVVFARKNFIYQRNEADRRFFALCFLGKLANCP